MSKDLMFWIEAEKGKFLLERLCKTNFNNGLAYFYLRQATRNLEQAKNKIGAAQSLYAVWSALSSEAFDLLQADFELDENWLLSLERANQHLFENVYSKLNHIDSEKVMLSLTHIYSEIRQKRPINLTDLDSNIGTFLSKLFE